MEYKSKLAKIVGLSLAVASGCTSFNLEKETGRPDYNIQEEQKEVLDVEINQAIAEIHTSDDPSHTRIPLYNLVEKHHGDIGSLLYLCENADSYQLECFAWASKDNPKLRDEICPELVKSAREFNSDISEEALNAYKEQCELGIPFFLY